MDKNIVLPDYNHSILNTISSILKYYNVETEYNGIRQLDEILQKKYDNIVLLILDGMGEHILKNISPNGFFNQNQLDVVTSVCPSTTTAAMTTYYSGKPPIETAWIAMSQYFKENGRAIEMLRKTDSYTGEKMNIGKFNVFDLIKYTPIYEKIENKNPEVKAYEINPTYCEARSKRNINADNIELLCDSIKAICNNNDKNFILAYSDNPDVILHKYGTDSIEVKNFLLNAEKSIENLCTSLTDTNSLIIISADHGHKNIKQIFNVMDLVEIQDCFIMPPSLESRAVTFWIKENKIDKFEKFFDDNFKDQFILYKTPEFLSKHLLGYGNKHPKIDDFLGNYVAIAIGDSIIKLGTNISKDKPNKKSTHCGFTKYEMEVPLIVIN